jgi:hypothetical protein
MAYAQSDVEKARDLEKQLPSIGDVDALNAEELEKLPGMFLALDSILGVFLSSHV